MKILLVNDDGIRAPGIQALYREVVRAGHEVCVAAPSDQRSAASHAITWKNPIRAREVQTENFRGYEIGGTPADCTRLGLKEFYPQADLVLSGINAGENMGPDTRYSGTVAAAMEGVLLGKPSMAVSLALSKAWNYTPAAQVACKVLEYIQSHPLPKDTMLNLNVPALPYEQIRGIRAADLADGSMVGAYDRYEDQLSGAWHYLRLTLAREPEEGTDRDLLKQGYAVTTLLQWALTSDAPYDMQGLSLDRGDRA